MEWIYPHGTADAEIRLINADGSEAEISGNGTRCVAAYLWDQKAKENLLLETGAGLKSCRFIGRDGREYEFESAMGKAVMGAEFSVNLRNGEVRGIPVSMGNPHYVLFETEFDGDWQIRAALIQNSGKFEQGVNVEMVVVRGKHDVDVRFFERGAGWTQSSGTGSCAAAVAAVGSGRAEFPVRVQAEGGTQTVNGKEGDIFLLGSARLVCRGEFFLNS